MPQASSLSGSRPTSQTSSLSDSRPTPPSSPLRLPVLGTGCSAGESTGKDDKSSGYEQAQQTMLTQPFVSASVDASLTKDDVVVESQTPRERLRQRRVQRRARRMSTEPLGELPGSAAPTNPFIKPSNAHVYSSSPLRRNSKSLSDPSPCRQISAPAALQTDCTEAELWSIRRLNKALRCTQKRQIANPFGSLEECPLPVHQICSTSRDSKLNKEHMTLERCNIASTEDWNVKVWPEQLSDEEVFDIL